MTSPGFSVSDTSISAWTALKCFETPAISRMDMIRIRWDQPSPAVRSDSRRATPTPGARKQGRLPTPPKLVPGRALLRRALAQVSRCALVETRVERIGHLLAVDQFDQHRGGAATHLERPLADLRVAASRFQRVELRRQRIAGNDDQLLRLQLCHHLVGHLRVGLRAELRPAADKYE